MGEPLLSMALDAAKRQKKRLAAPDVVTKPEQRHLENLTCPYREEDERLWHALLLDCFGTRSYAVAQCFLRQLEALCPQVYYEGENERRRDEDVLKFAIHIVAGIKPRNELEAAAAAQYVALHLTAMKLGERIARYDYVDPRSAASLAALTKAAAAQHAVIQSGRGRKTSRQTIIVKKENHVHHHYDDKHVHLPPQGGEKAGGQPHAAEELRACARPAGEPSKCPALPSPDESGEVVPFPIGEGAKPVPDARRGQGFGRSEG